MGSLERHSFSTLFAIILIGTMKSTFYFILVCGIGGYVADGFLQTGQPSGFVPVWPQSQPSQNSVPIWDNSENRFSQPKCTQKIVDGETLLRVINAIIEDIPDICLSKFKMCGGFNEGHQGKPVFPSFWRSMGEEFDLQDDNSTSTNNSTFSSHRMRRSADDYYESEYKNEYEGEYKDYDNKPKYGYEKDYDYKPKYGYDRGYDRDYGYPSYRQNSYRKPYYYSRGRPYYDHAYDQRFYDLMADYHAYGGNANGVWLH